jgi:hypothetical protein
VNSRVRIQTFDHKGRKGTRKKANVRVTFRSEGADELRPTIRNFSPRSVV